MNSVERRFKQIQEKNPGWSAYVCLGKAVEDRKLNRETIIKHFNSLIPKDDYKRSEKQGLIHYLVVLSNP